jgi:hypothetical protein
MGDKTMATVNDHQHDLDTQDARQGKELGTVRWVLRISLGLAVLAGIIIYFSYADFFHT